MHHLIKIKIQLFKIKRDISDQEHLFSAETLKTSKFLISKMKLSLIKILFKFIGNKKAMKKELTGRKKNYLKKKTIRLLNLNNKIIMKK